MRETPSTVSKAVNLDVYLVGFDKEVKGSILHKNSVNSFDAVTVKEDTIDGITAPWYRVTVILNEVYSKKVWVFGGYVQKIPEIEYRNNSVDYYQKYYNTLKTMKVIE